MSGVRLFSVEPFDTPVSGDSAQESPPESIHFPTGSSFEVEAEQYVHQPFGEQLAVHIGQYAAVGDAMFQYFGKRVQPETTVFFVGIGIAIVR